MTAPAADPGSTSVVPADSRPPVPVVAALDVGGTSIKAGLIAHDGTVMLEARRPTDVQLGPDAVIERILSFVADLTGKAPVRGIGLCVPGVVDSAAGIARYAANLGWRDTPFVELLTDRFGIPAALGHDVRAGALAEARAGAGVGAGSVYFVAIGTGIAAGLVTAGELYNGSSGQAGEVGHLVVRPGGPLCGCGNRGCLEAIASASRLGRRYAAETGRETSAKDLFLAVAAGDPVAGAIWAEAIDALADALAAVCVLEDPGLIVVGGGLSLAGPTLLEPLARALAPRLTFRSAPPLVVAALGDRAGLAGAALLGWDAVASAEAGA
ncbi:MAG: ROK family protein [Williamsia herbipolensis]|nr:ROK family protein [Williamsia herbipolensis]